MGESLIIAVDGPAAAGKGTLARALAERLKLTYLDTGKIYRAVAARLLEAGNSPEDEEAATFLAEGLTAEDLTREDLRSEAVGQAASQVASYPGVRQALLEFQRAFAQHPPAGYRGAVLDGRDIATVVCPEAQVKFFITASDEARATRRHKELLERGEESIYARVLEELQQRDARDRSRSTAPLSAAADAFVLDTTDLGAKEVFELALERIAEVAPEFC